MSAIAETKVVVTCDCGCGVNLQWIEQEVQKDANAVPDEFYRMISVDTWDEKAKQHVKRVYMSYNCLRRAFKDYMPPMSPRERTALEQHNLEVEAKRQQKKHNELPTYDIAPDLEHAIAAAENEGVVG